MFKFKAIHIILVVLITGVFSNCSPKIEKTELISTKILNLPLIIGNKNNLVMRIAIEANKKNEVIKRFGLNLGETNPEILQTVRIYSTGLDSTYFDEKEFGVASDIKKHMQIIGNQILEIGENYFWVSFELQDKVDLLSILSLHLDFVQIENDKKAALAEKSDHKLRVGIALRRHNDDEVHTYRIPGLATTKQGTLLAIYDVRRESGRDLQGNIDIGLSRSTDKGNTWESMRIVLDMGEWGGLPQKFNGVSDANILVDENSGNIFIAGLWMHGVINEEGEWINGLNEDSRDWNHQWRNKGSQPGFGVKETSQFLITKSADDGKTWSKPVNITKMCKNPKWWLWAPAPGHGITLGDGTLIFPTQGRDENGLPFSNITFSKDGGETWETSNAAYTNTTESMAVELEDGSIMLNMRNNRNRMEKGEKNGRAIAITKDLGETWTEHESSCNALIEPVCMASLHRQNCIDGEGKEKSILFFSNPNSKYKRHKQTIKVSFDDGLTWPEKYWIELDEGRSAGYSCLTSIDNSTVGILYEGSKAQMTFQQIDISEIRY